MVWKEQPDLKKDKSGFYNESKTEICHVNIFNTYNSSYHVLTNFHPSCPYVLVEKVCLYVLDSPPHFIVDSCTCKMKPRLLQG